MAHLALIQLAQVAEDLIADGDEDAPEVLLVHHRRALIQVEDDVVDILDEDDIGIQRIEVADQRAVPPRAEEQATILAAEEPPFRGQRQRIGRGLLLAEAHQIAHAVVLLVAVLDARYEALEVTLMLRGDGEVQVYLTEAIASVEGALDEVLLQCGALDLVVAVEEEQPLRFASIAQPLRQEQRLHDGLIVALR